MTPSALIRQALRYKRYWGKEGGITVSGGEPLLQIDFMNELFRLAKENGVGTVLDTAGQPFTREDPFFSKFTDLMENTDLVMSALSGGLYGNIVQKCLRKEGKRALTKLLQAGTGHSWIGIHAGYQLPCGAIFFHRKC